MENVKLVKNSANEDYTDRTLLREVRLGSFKGNIAEQETANSSGFWSRVLKQPQTRESTMTRVSHLKFDIGGWINLPPGIHSAVSLLLVFEDRVGEHQVIIDQMNARGATQILLSGSAEINALGKIRQMAVYCGGIKDQTVWIDDMHLKTAELGSNYISVAS